jgi:hypothetical protein
LGFIPDELARRLGAGGVPQAQINEAIATWQAQAAQNNNWASSLPVAGNWGDVLAGGTGMTIRELAPFNWDWYSHPNYDAYWQTINPLEHMADVNVPALIGGGWYDLFTVGTIDSYLGMRATAGTEAAREGTTLSMDCCGHAINTQGVPGQINWGPNRAGTGFTPVPLTMRFFDYYLKGIDNGFTKLPRVQLSVMVPPDMGLQGDTFILQADDYPVPGTTYERYYLGSSSSANTRMGDGVLSQSGSHGHPADTFTYDPNDPVPTAGGADGATGGGRVAVDQSTIELRNDVLVYTSATLSQPNLIVGPVKIHFWASTSADDTDFSAKLVDVHPDGFAHNVVDRIVRARYREGSKLPPKLITPNHVYEYELLLGHTATEIPAGHRIRLEISSSNFPHYARNLNTGLSNETTDHTVVATQHIFHDQDRPSYLDLPVLRMSAECIAQAHITKVTRCRADQGGEGDGTGDR